MAVMILLPICVSTINFNQAPGLRPAVGTHLVFEVVFQKVCVYVCLYICLSFSDHVSKPLTGESSPYMINKG